MTWPGFPKRLQSALKALCCLAQHQGPMLSQEISAEIDVPAAETAKILQLLVWGGFVSSRRGTKGGFHLALSADRITMGKVIDFFLTRHPAEAEETSPVMQVLQKSIAPCQKVFARLSLADVARAAKPPRRRTSTTVSSNRPNQSESMPKQATTK